MKKPRLATPEAREQDRYQLQPCRGCQGACPFALVKDPSFARQIDLAVRASAWWQCLHQGNGKALPHHLWFRVALAACPNACTMPQIRAIGIIATRTPRAVGPQCNGCGGCERTCREGAIVVDRPDAQRPSWPGAVLRTGPDARPPGRAAALRAEGSPPDRGRAELQPEKCVGCGQCISRCPSQVIEAGPVRARVLVGGRMGRHPRWAQELCEVDLASAAEVVRAFLDCVGRESPPAEHVADVVERIGLERIRQE